MTARGGIFAEREAPPRRGPSACGAAPPGRGALHRRIAGVVLGLAVGVASALPAPAEDPAPGLIADLVADLCDGDPHVRETARKAIVRLGAPCAAPLAELAGQPDEARALLALEVLGDIGPPAKAAIGPVIARGTTAGGSRLCAVARAVARIDPSTATPLVAPLARIAVANDVAAASEALAALTALGTVAAPAADVLAERLASAAPALRKPIAEAIRAAGADPAEPVLRLWFTSPQGGESWVPALLAELGDGAAQAVAARLRAPDRDLRVRAADLLGALGPAARVVTTDLLASLSDEAAAVRRAAARALGGLGADGVPALPPLAAGIADAAGRWQREAIAASERICLAVAHRADATAPDARRLDAAITDGLDWLARHQSPDGRWDAEGFGGHLSGGACAGAGRDEYDVGVTGLAVLAFLGAGEAHAGKTDAARRGLEFLRAAQGGDGCVGARSCQHWMYNHELAALALVEGWRATRGAPLRTPAQRAFEFTLSAQSEGLGWRYGIRDGDNDTSSTAWGALVADAAESAGLGSARKPLAGALAWVEKMTDAETGRTGYQQRGGLPARTNEMGTRFPSAESEALTAAGLVVRLAAGRTVKTDPALAKGVALVAAKPPRGTPGSPGWDIYSWLHGTTALRQVGGPVWDAWRRATIDTFLASQERAACERGSWRADDPWAADGGRVSATAMAVRCLTLCVTPPEKRPAMPAEVRAAVAALAGAARSGDPQVQADAAAALERIRQAFR